MIRSLSSFFRKNKTIPKQKIFSLEIKNRDIGVLQKSVRVAILGGAEK